MNEKYTACYIRLSVEDGNEGESDSIANQRLLLKDFIAGSPGLSGSKSLEFCDEGYSGTNFERPGIKALLEEVGAGHIGCIIVKDFSRFGRNYIELGNYLEQVFPFLGVRFISVNDRFDSMTFEGITGGIDVAFKNLVYDLYSKDLSQKSRSARNTKMKKGDFLSRQAPYGYKKSKDDKHKLVVDEAAAAVVKRIFQMAGGGMNAVRIAAALNAEGIPTPFAYKRMEDGKEHHNPIGDKNYWLNSTILHIIRDERYTGKMVSGRYRSPQVGAGYSKRVPEEEWIVIPNTHEAIVSYELFISVQDQFKAPARSRKARDTKRPLEGNVKCGSCRHMMLKSKTLLPYYFCRSHSYLADSGCTREKVHESLLEEIILAAIQIQMKMAPDIDGVMGEQKVRHHAGSSKLQEQLRQLKGSHARLKLLKMETYEAYKAGRLDKGLYIRRKEELDRGIGETGLHIEKLEYELQRLSTGCRPPDFTEGPKKRDNAIKLTRELAEQLVSTVYVYGSERIEIVWNYGDRYLKLREI